MNEKIERKCKVCNKSFKPMTEKQWKFVKPIHDDNSKRHKIHLNLKSSS